MNLKPSYPLRFNQNNQFWSKKSPLEKVVFQLGTQLESLGASIKNLKTQLVQLLNSFNSRTLDLLPSYSKINPKEIEKDLSQTI